MMVVMTHQSITANSNENAIVQRDVVRGAVQFNGDVDSLFAALGIEEAVAELV